MTHEFRTTLLIMSFQALSGMGRAKSGLVTDLGSGFYLASDGSTCFYMTRFISQNMLPPTDEFVDFARSCMNVISHGEFGELMD